MNIRLGVVLAALAAPLACAAAGDGKLKAASAAIAAPGSEIQLFIENDMLARTDRYYTNGIKVGLGVSLDAIQAPAEWLLRRLAPDGEDVHLGLFVGQNLYTPKSIAVRESQPGDRPWAAWAYLGGVAQRWRGNRLDTVELDLGMVGSPALGRQVQSGWHKLIGSPQPLGWHHQIPSEPAFLVSYLHKRRFAAGAVDIVPHAGVTVGTAMTLARVGAIARIGHNMSGFGPDTVEPGGAMLQNMRRSADPGGDRGSEWYGFVGFDQRLVAQNIFLDGAVFSGGPGVERHRHVYDLRAGVAVRVEKLRISVTRVRRSAEFSTPMGNGGRQTFDSVNLGWEF